MNTIKSAIESTKGKFFKIEFIKSDGSKRLMTARTGVHKGISGVGRRYELKDNMVCVYDVVNKGFRTINTDNVLSVKCGKLVNITV